MTIKELRMKAGLTQDALARELGCTQETVSRIESGERRPSPELAQKIAGYFKLSVRSMWEMFYTDSN